MDKSAQVRRNLNLALEQERREWTGSPEEFEVQFCLWIQKKMALFMLMKQVECLQKPIQRLCTDESRSKRKDLQSQEIMNEATGTAAKSLGRSKSASNLAEQGVSFDSDDEDSIEANSPQEHMHGDQDMLNDQEAIQPSSLQK